MSKNKRQLAKHDRRGMVAQTGTYFAGPLPPPQILEKYNSIVPGSAERIIKMAE
jgi:uncharacterized membrane protein